MARIVLNGAMVQDMHGSMGSAVVSKWKGLHYIRLSSPNISNSRTAPQMKMRNGLVSSLIGWRGLTPAQRAQWEEYAQAQGSMSADDSQVGSKGIIPSPSRTQAGVNAFIGINQKLRSVGLAPVTIPPLGSLPGAVLLFANFHLPDVKVSADFSAPPPPDVVLRIFGRGVWSGSSSYIVGGVYGNGISVTLGMKLTSWRVGSESIPLVDLPGRVLSFHVDCVSVDGRVAPSSNVAFVTLA